MASAASVAAPVRLFAPMPRLLIALGFAVLVGALVLSSLGVFGGVGVCGADRAPGCVSWPAPVSGVVWIAFVLGVAGLLVWQVRFLDR